ncbi:MAG: DoxX family membrane protein, partial [Bacteroidales bacterium]|nr:DoxX family membrane protein [Bacteroidales bacterium]
MTKTFKEDFPKLLITILRMAIGWYFLYEGISKLLIKDWSSFSYLANTTGPLSGFYHWLASSESLLQAVDIINIYGLVFIGLALVTGLLSRISSSAAVLLLGLYYFAYPPFGDSLLNAEEGHLYIVNMIFVEAAALLLLLFLKERGYGIDALIRRALRKREKSQREEREITHSGSRREMLKNLASVPFLGLMGWGAINTNRKYGIDALSGATIRIDRTSPGELKGVLPRGKIGNHEISRLILGGNLIGGWAHSRDLIYVSSLFMAYNTERKIYETLILSENAGINTINI